MLICFESVDISSHSWSNSPMEVEERLRVCSISEERCIPAAAGVALLPPSNAATVALLLSPSARTSLAVRRGDEMKRERERERERVCICVGERYIAASPKEGRRGLT